MVNNGNHKCLRECGDNEVIFLGFGPFLFDLFWISVLYFFWYGLFNIMAFFSDFFLVDELFWYVLYVGPSLTWC